MSQYVIENSYYFDKFRLHKIKIIMNFMILNQNQKLIFNQMKFMTFDFKIMI